MESTININLDMSGFKQVEKACKALSHTVEVGILHNPREAKIAELQHNGGIGTYYYGPFEGEEVSVPQRPFLREAMEFYGKEILEDGLSQMKDFTEESAEKTLNRVGDESKYIVQKQIDYYAQAGGNSLRTIITKGKDSPLIDKGDMRASIEYEVIK